MTLPQFTMAQCGCMDEQYQWSWKLWFRHFYLWLSLQMLEVHINGIRDITIHISESKIHISYSEKHDSTLFFFYFYMSPLPTHAHTTAKSSNFSISSPFDATKLQQKNCLDVSSTGSFPFPMLMDTHIHITYNPYGYEESTLI